MTHTIKILPGVFSTTQLFHALTISRLQAYGYFWNNYFCS